MKRTMYPVTDVSPSEFGDVVTCTVCKVSAPIEAAAVEHWMWASVILHGKDGGYFCPPCAALEEN